MCGSTCMEGFKNEFTIARLKLGGCDREEFTASVWFKSPLPLLIYRLVAAIFCLVILVYTVASKPFIGSQMFFVLEYFTNWTYIVLVGYFTFGFTNSMLAYIRLRKPEILTPNRPRPGTHETLQKYRGVQPTASEDVEIRDDVPVNEVKLAWNTKAQWILYNILPGNAILVTLIYWGLIYPQRKASKENFTTNFPDVAVHAINSVFICIEILISNIPSRLLHFFHPIIYAIIYLIMATIRWAFDHDKVIYKGVMDWNKPGQTSLVILGMFLYFTVGQLLMFMIYRLKKSIASRVPCSCL